MIYDCRLRRGMVPYVLSTRVKFRMEKKPVAFSVTLHRCRPSQPWGSAGCRALCLAAVAQLRLEEAPRLDVCVQRGDLTLPAPAPHSRIVSPPEAAKVEGRQRGGALTAKSNR